MFGLCLGYEDLNDHAELRRDVQLRTAVERDTPLQGMLCLADRSFFGFALWMQARAAAADLLWHIKTNARLPREQPLADGTYLSRMYPPESARRHQRNGVTVMHEAALKADTDPDQLSLLHAVRVLRRNLATFNAVPPSAAENVS